MSLSFSLTSPPHHPKPRLKAGLKDNSCRTEWTNSNINSKTSYRLGFLGLQKDKESNLGDHGVRKYDSEIGRFLAIDPLWEKYNTLNPYQYSGNSPVMMADWNGMEFGFGNEEVEGFFNQFYNSLDDGKKSLFDIMRADKSQMYYFDISKDLPKDENGRTIYNFEQNRLDILISNKADSKLATMADEATTASQFATGRLAYRLISDGMTAYPIYPDTHATLETDTHATLETDTHATLETDTKIAGLNTLIYYRLTLPQYLSDFYEAYQNNTLIPYYTGFYADPQNPKAFFDFSVSCNKLNSYLNNSFIIFK